MEDKQKLIQKSGDGALQALGSLAALSAAETIQAMRSVMDPKQLQMFDLSLFCESETLKSQDAGAHFASCLMGAAMNEALLALMCLKYESEVKQTRQFQYSTKKKIRPFIDVVGDWSFEQFINIAEQSRWIPAEIVDEAYKDLLAEGFRELMPVTHPEMGAEEIEAGASVFYLSPGPATLRMTQELRNAIHAGRWLRGTSAFVPENFSQWCQVATRLCGEIRNCLLLLLVQRERDTAEEQLSKVQKMLDGLPAEYRAMFEAEIRTRFGLAL